MCKEYRELGLPCKREGSSTVWWEVGNSDPRPDRRSGLNGGSAGGDLGS